MDLSSFGAARAGGRTILVVPPAPAVRVVQPPHRSDLMPTIEEVEFRGGSSESEVPDDRIPVPGMHVQFDAPDYLESPRLRGGPFLPTTRKRPLSSAFTARWDEQAERHRKEMQALSTAAKKRPASNKKERSAPVPLVPNAQTAEHRAASMDKGQWGKRDTLQALKEGFKNEKPPNFTPQQKFRGTMAPGKVPAPVGTARPEPPQQGGGVPAAAVPPAKSSSGSSPPRGNNVLLPRAARAATPAAGGHPRATEIDHTVVPEKIPDSSENNGSTSAKQVPDLRTKYGGYLPVDAKGKPLPKMDAKGRSLLDPRGRVVKPGANANRNFADRDHRVYVLSEHKLCLLPLPEGKSGTREQHKVQLHVVGVL